jgi:hypothetical protein
VRSTIASRDVKLDVTPTARPVTIVVTCGVLKRGCTRANTSGSIPSRAIAKKMRGCPSWKTSSTAVCATTEPKATTPTIHRCMPTCFMARVSGSACSLARVALRSG